MEEQNKKTRNRMTKEEKQDWDNLYQYIKKDILKYSDDIKLPQYMILRLKGMKDGKFIANGLTDKFGNYSFKVILYTFKYCKFDILQYLEKNKSSFKDEKHKFNGIMLIVEGKINDVVLRLNNSKRSEEKVENLELENQSYQGAEYKKRSKKTKTRLDDLW